MLKLKTKVSLAIVVLWLICSLGWLGTKWRTAGGAGRDSFANVSLHDPLAFLAGYVATPVVLAVAALHQLLRVRVVAAATAHQVTAVTANRGFVALPVLCANRALFVILGAEIRGALQVDQLVLPHWPDVNVFGYQLLACPHGPVDHFGGRQVLGLQVHGDLPQVLQPSPAGPY